MIESSDIISGKQKFDEEFTYIKPLPPNNTVGDNATSMKKELKHEHELERFSDEGNPHHVDDDCGDDYRDFLESDPETNEVDLLNEALEKKREYYATHS